MDQLHLALEKEDTNY